MEEEGREVSMLCEKTKAGLMMKEGPMRNMATSRSWEKPGIIFYESLQKEGPTVMLAKKTCSRLLTYRNVSW